MGRKSDAEIRELRILKEMRTCVHFNGIQNDCCKAGVNYRDLAGEPLEGSMRRIPCLVYADDDESKHVHCEKRVRPNREEAEKEVAASERSMADALKCMTAAHDDARAKGFKVGLGGADSIVCPTGCGGRLYYRVASINGHMHAKCDTKDCASWME